MDVGIYIDSVEQSLAIRNPVVAVEPFTVSRTSGDRAVIKARIHFYNGSQLEFTEYVDSSPCYCDFLGCTYQYFQEERAVFRYDNSPHHHHLGTYPHHKHVWTDQVELVIESSRPNHSELFAEILSLLT